MAINLNARLQALEKKLNPVVGAPVLIFADDMEECTVGDIVVYRFEDETADNYFDRCSELYDKQCGNRPALSVRIRCAEAMI